MSSVNKITLAASLSAVVLITVIAFYPSLNNGFPNWDDGAYLTENAAVKELSWHSIKTMFTSFYVACYLPLTILSYALEYRFFGLDPFAYHATSLILHLGNCLLVFWFIFMLRANITAAFITALLFGIHPLHVESVAWVSERKDVLCTLFFLAALISYLYYHRKAKSPALYSLALALFMCALLSKAMAITLPCVLLLCDYFNQRAWNRKLLWEKVPFFLLAAIFAAVALYAQHSLGGVRNQPSVSLLDTVAIAGYGLVFYLAKILVPLNLSCLYPYPNMAQGLPVSFYAGAMLAFILLAAAAASVRYAKDLSFGALFFFITIAPVLQLVPIGQAMAADRYTYIPSIGLLYLAAEGFARLCGSGGEAARKRNRLLLPAAIFICAMLCVLTWQRCLVWKDGVTLWNDVIRNYPLDPVAYHNRALAFKDAGDYERAIADFTTALTMSPQFIDAYNNRGLAYKNKKEFKKALADFDTALSLSPRYAKAWCNRGLTFTLTGEYRRAVDDLTRAVALDPQFAIAFYNRGNAFAALAEDERAIADYTRALDIDACYAEAYNNRANLLLKKNAYDQAIADYSQALKFKPEFTTARYNRAVAWYEKGDYKQAWAEVRVLQASGFRVSGEFLQRLQQAAPRGAAQ
ncbi:MAG: tetratricopeptide repeat protein [Proteobacteria bacterium]|nr:tetratricopeptide repeat protein [Pseudomonadota bacterium]